MTRMNLSRKRKQTHVKDRFVVAEGGGGGGGVDWEFRVSRCRLLYIEWINSEVPL